MHLLRVRLFLTICHRVHLHLPDPRIRRHSLLSLPPLWVTCIKKGEDHWHLSPLR